MRDPFHFLNAFFLRIKQDRKIQLVWIKIGTAALLILSLSFMFPGGRALRFADMKEGSISTRRIVAPFNFEILKSDEEYERDRQEAARKEYRIFTRDEKALETATGNIDTFFRRIFTWRREAARRSFPMEALMDSLFSGYSIGVLNESQKSQLLSPRGGVSDPLLREVQNLLTQTIRDLLAVGLLDQNKENEGTSGKQFILEEEGQEKIVRYDDIYDLNEAREQGALRIRTRQEWPEILKTLAFRALDLFLRPNLHLNETVTNERIRTAQAQVPRSSGYIYESEKIVDKNERITPEIRRKLDSLARIMSEKGMQEGGLHFILPFLGRALFIFLILFLFVLFIRINQPRILADPKSIILLGMLILLISLITFVLKTLDVSEYLVPVGMGALLMAILYDSRLGYAGSAILATLCAGLWGNEFSVLLICFFTGAVGVRMTIRVRNRGQMVKIMAALAGAYFLVAMTLGIIQVVAPAQVAKNCLWGALSGLLIPVITFGLLPLLESGFGITTEYSLLELSNLNHILLKKLSMAAPGTYHHSITVGNLAEAGAQAIGANSLLARVGSYYHDIGKMEKAEYFAENLLPGEEPHAKLMPRMSALIIMNHVKKGLELARQYKLSRDIQDIIGQHHGNTKIEFFYSKAKNASNSEDVSEEDYRYPGPRPQTKEAAVVMLADAVEAASRALKSPTHARLKGLVNEIVDEKFRDRQLDESPFTLRDMERIKESFLKILAGMFHARLEYPDKEEAPAA